MDIAKRKLINLIEALEDEHVVEDREKEGPKRAVADNLMLKEKVGRLQTEVLKLLNEIAEKDTKIDSLLDTIMVLELSLKEQKEESTRLQLQVTQLELNLKNSKSLVIEKSKIIEELEVLLEGEDEGASI